METIVNPYIYVGIKYAPLRSKSKEYRSTIASDYAAQLKSISNTDRLESLLHARHRGRDGWPGQGLH